MNRIIEVLMNRDGITEGEARELYDDTRANIMQGVEDGIYTYEDVEAIMMDDLGLEMDYLIEML